MKFATDGDAVLVFAAVVVAVVDGDIDAAMTGLRGFFFDVSFADDKFALGGMVVAAPVAIVAAVVVAVVVVVTASPPVVIAIAAAGVVVAAVVNATATLSLTSCGAHDK